MQIGKQNFLVGTSIKSCILPFNNFFRIPTNGFSPLNIQ